MAFTNLDFLVVFTSAAPEMSVRMSNLDNERDERDEDSHEDRGISMFSVFLFISIFLVIRCKNDMRGY